ncbi:hypothetical protein ABK040_010037 [Willaertia magna]
MNDEYKRKELELKAKVFEQENKIEEAISCYEQLNNNNTNTENYIHLAHLYGEIKNFNKYIENYQRVLEINNNHPKKLDILYNLGIGHFELQNYNKSIEYFEQVLKLNNKHIDAYYDLGIIYGMLSNENKAMECFKKVMELNPLDDRIFLLKEYLNN